MMSVTVKQRPFSERRRDGTKRHYVEATLLVGGEVVAHVDRLPYRKIHDWRAEMVAKHAYWEL